MPNLAVIGNTDDFHIGLVIFSIVKKKNTSDDEQNTSSIEEGSPSEEIPDDNQYLYPDQKMNDTFQE